VRFMLFMTMVDSLHHSCVGHCLLLDVHLLYTVFHELALPSVIIMMDILVLVISGYGWDEAGLNSQVV